MENSVQEVATPNPEQGAKTSDREANIVKLRQEKERLAYELDLERQQRVQLQQQMEQKKQLASEPDDDEGDDSYVEMRKLKKTLAREREAYKREAQDLVRQTIEEADKKNFMIRLKSDYRDFEEVLNTDTANRFQEQYPQLAETILKVPDEYERRKLAYETIKSLGVHKPKKDDSIQQKVDKNLRNPYYYPQTASTGASPLGDFSEAGQKAAYQKMRDLMSKGIGNR